MSSALDRLLVSASHARPGLAIHTEIALREAHAGDESGLAPITPGAVIVARDADDVSAVLSLATRERVSVTPRAGATGKAGGAIPDADGIALVLTGLDRELEIDAGDRIAVAGAGVVLAKLREAARAQHLFYGPDPSSLESATIGGNVATNASGPSSLKHGSTARWVRGLEVVTGAGTHLAMPSRVSKSTVGLDLAQLLVGSEGMLGVVTRVFVRLEPAPERVALASVSLSSLESIGPALVAIDRAHVAPRAIELLDDEALSTLRAARTDHALDPRAVAILFVELEGSEHGVDDDLSRLDDALSPIAIDVRLARNETEREALWKIRRDTSVALKKSAKHKLSEDVVVPRSKVGALIATARRLGVEHGVRMPSYGHAGDGNLHVNFLWEDDAQRPDVDRAMAALFREVIALGGTISGEHGIGRAKAAYLPLAHDPARLAMQREVKRLFDPAGILNPGKVLG
ncbi:MAG: FAD-binding protein [Deltaproteobacteria bacterium]|nr:FAD-binding protein [Deltaproteobacteria bacterium]